MSVNHVTYVLYGALLSHPDEDGDEDALYEALEPYRDNRRRPEIGNKDGITVIFDSMGGEYVAVGHVIAKSAMNCPINNVSMTDPNLPTDDWLVETIKVVKAFDLNPDKLGYRIGWHVVTVYS